MNLLIESFAHWLADYYLLSSVILTLALAAMAFNRQPAQRRVITQSSLIALILLAALCALPGWSMVSLLSASPTDTRDESMNVIEAKEFLLVDAAPSQSNNTTALLESAAVDPNDTAEADAKDNTFAFRDLPWARIASVVWAIGAACIAVWLAMGSLAAARLRRKSQPVPAELLRFMSNVDGSAQRTTLLTSTEIDVAVALGIWRPVVMLPQKWVTSPNEPSTHDLRTILAHELAHIQNHDLCWLAVSRALLILLWSQPLYWLVRRRMRLDQEALADAAAAELTSRQHYAEQLVAWAREVSSRPTMYLSSAVGLWEGPSQLRRRIALLLDDQFTMLRQCPRRWQIAALALSILATLSLSLVTLEPMAKANEDPTTFQQSANADTTLPPADPTDRQTIGDAALKDVAKPIPNTIQGRLIDEARQPVAGAEVTLFRVNHNDASRRKLAQTTTDADGRYRFDNVIDIAKEFPGGEIPSLDFMPVEFVQVAWRRPGRVSDAWLDMPQRVARYGMSQQNVVLKAARLRGRVTDPDGKPVEGALVSCGSQALEHWEGAKSDRTDANGNYEINDVAPFDIAEYRKQQEEDQRKREEQARQGGNTFLFFRAPPMLTVEHPNFAVKKTSYDAIPGTKDVTLDPPAIIEGRVVDSETGKPAAHVIVGVGTARTNNLVPAADMTYSYHRAVTRTDEQGNYRFSTLPIGTYDIWAEMPGRVNEGETGVATAADQPTIVPDLKLIVGVPVTIGLTDHKSGKPLTVPVGTQASVGAQLTRLNTIGRSDGTQRAAANADGKFEIRALPGRNRIWVNGVDVDGEMKWLGNELEEIDVVKAQPASVDIKVMDADDAQVTGTFSTVMTAPRPSRKQLEAMVETATAALEKDPDSAETLIARAQALQNLGEYRKAIADYEWLMDLNPQQQINVIAHNNLAYILSTAPDDKIRDGKRALQLAKKAVELNPTIADAHDTLAAAHAELGDFDKAIESQQKAIELRPEGKSVREHLKLYQQSKPLRENSSTNVTDAPEGPANDEGASLNGETTEDSHEDDEHTHITIIVAKHGLVHDGKVIEWADVERLITAEPDTKLVHPIFKFTRSGAETHQEDLRAKIWDFRKRVALHGHSWGSVSPDEYQNYDGIQRPPEPVQEDKDAKPAAKVELGNQTIRVVDESDQPIAGVTVRSEQFFSDDDKRIEWVKRTDANGRASLPYPRNMVERYGIQSATFTFTHPHFVPKYDSVSLGAREAVVKLARGGRVEVTAVAEDGWNVGTLYALIAKLDPRIPWSREGGETIRSPQLAAGETFVRAVSFRKDGHTLFSSVRPVDVETGEVAKLSVELRPGFKLDGALDGNVPRPVRNGRVLLSISAAFDSGWSDWTTVREDGTFTFDSLPADSGAKAQLVAVCEGFVSASTNSEYQNAGIMIPQTFALGSTSEMAVVEMQPAGNCTVKVLDPAGKPLAGVRVQAMPNYLVGLNGTTSLGTVGGTKQMLLQGRDYQPRTDLEAFPYQATSNYDGVVELSNLPPFQMYLTAANDDYELPRDPSFYPLAMPITRMQVKSGGMSRVNLTLVSIKTTR